MIEALFDVAQAAPETLPWDKIIAATGGAGLVTMLSIFFFRMYRDSIRELVGMQSDSNTKVAASFAEAVRDGHTKLSESTNVFARSITDRGTACDANTAMLIREQRAAHETAQQKLLEALSARR